MPKKGENIRKRQDGRWEGRYKKGRNTQGRILYGSVYGKSYREVKEKMTEMLLRSQKEEESACFQKDKMFGEVLSLWMCNNRIRYKGATENKYQYLIEKHIMPQLGDIKVSELTAPRINTFLMEKMERGRLDCGGGLSPAYVRNIMLIVNSALKFAADEQMCPPLKTAIYKPTVPKEELTIFNVEEQKKLERFLTKEPNPTKAGILLSIYAGLRIGEVCALSWEDIDLENRIIHVRHTVARVKDNNSQMGASKLIIDSPKTKASCRDIPIVSGLLPILEELKEKSESKYVVSNTMGFMSPRTYDYRYHKLLEKCDIPTINYHALRHTFATRCIEAGVDVKSLSEILGHSNVGITLNTYVHSSMELKRTQIEKLSTLLS